MNRKTYLRFSEPREIVIGGVKVSFTEWHWLEVSSARSEEGSPTKVKARDCRGHVIEIPQRDLCAWSRRLILTKDFGPLGIHETVDVPDPTTCDGETVVVLAGKTEIRVPVSHLAPFAGRHAHEGASAV